MSKKALITGITGQDGAYLAEFLLSPKATKCTASSAAPRFSTPT
jgi:GDP-D-mannose dehydratase